MQTKTLTVKVTTTGGPGMAQGNASVGIPGPISRLLALGVDYHAACPATTCLFVYCSLPVDKKVLELVTRNVDFPLSQVTEVEVDPSGVARAAPATVYPLVGGMLTVTVMWCDALVDAVTVTAVVEV
jgi:hypothetical protein